MDTKRLEAFSDAVLAIIMTILVLELKVPRTSDPAELFAMWPVFISFLLSFYFVAITWNIHHHVMKLTTRVDEGVIWANVQVLLNVALLPFATAWMGEQSFARWPTTLFGLLMVWNAGAWSLLEHRIIVAEGPEGPYAQGVRSDARRKITPLVYLAATVAAAANYPHVAFVALMVVCMSWMAPDHLFRWHLRRTARS